MSADELMLRCPAHIKADQVVDFDLFHPFINDQDLFVAMQSLQKGPDIFWTPRNTGHWVVTRGDYICEALKDSRRFSSRSVFIPRLKLPRLIPLEVDPPYHAAYRRFLNPVFRPNHIKNLLVQARVLAVNLIEEIQPRGQCDFVTEFAQQFPIITFLNMCDLPLRDRDQLLNWINSSSRSDSDVVTNAARTDIAAYIDIWLERRRQSPGDDLLSFIIKEEFDGRKLTHEECRSVALGLLAGGLDAVAASMSWMAWFLANSPAHRQQLIADPYVIPNAVEELLRRFSVSNIGRVVTEDLQFHGVDMRAGDQVWLSTCLHGLDQRSFENPLLVNFYRDTARKHSAYSQGIHHCPGASLASQQLAIFLEEWLRYIPDFSVAPESNSSVATGIVHSLGHLSLVW